MSGLSSYYKAFPCKSHPGHSLLFSTKTTALTLLPEGEFEKLRQGEIADEYVAPLSEMGFLIVDKEAEKQEIYDFYKNIGQYSTKISVSQVLGMECNFSCRYCFEGILKGKKAMDDMTADQVIAYLKGLLINGKKDLDFIFYGGEPLLYKERIKYLAERLKPHVEGLGGTFSFNLVTNGSLLTGKVCEELRPLGLQYAKVTIDGLAENHNHFRPFKGGAPSFEIIINNLKEACEVIEIGLGANFTKDNYRQYPALLDYLTGHSVGPDKLERVMFGMVMKISDEFSHPEFQGGCASINEPWLVDATLFLREEAMKRGHYVSELRPEVCAICVEDSLSIAHDGAIFKCLPLVGREQFKVGDVWSGVGDYSEIHYLDRWQTEDKCKSCVYLPMCYGGCRFMEYLRSGNMAKVDCQKEFFDKALGSILMQDLKYRYGTSTV